MVPVLPFFFLFGTMGIVVSAVVSMAAHFAVGAAGSASRPYLTADS
jgi:vacuolar iron transporter family protein